MARRGTVQKRSIHEVCEHFELVSQHRHGHLDCY